MESGRRNVLLVGDRIDTLNFITQFLNENSSVSLKEKCRDSVPVIELAHSESLVEEIMWDKKENIICALSAEFPSGIRILTDLSEEDWTNCHSIQNTELILFVESFPFVKKSLEDKLEGIGEFLARESDDNSLKNIQFRVVFFRDRKQHFGATDKVNIETALKYEKDKLVEELEKKFPISSFVDFAVYEDVTDLIKIVSGNQKTLEILTLVGKKKFQQWSSDLEYYKEDYKLEYQGEFDVSLRVETIHNRVNKFSSVRECRDIMEEYVKNYQKKCFGDIKKIAIEQYKKIVQDICFWDIDKDVSILSDKLDELCLKKLTFREEFSCPKSQVDYQKILTREKIDIKFYEKLKKFEENDVPDFVHRYLKKREEILAGLFIQ